MSSSPVSSYLFPELVMKELDDTHNLKCNTNDLNDAPQVELTVDEEGLHIYGSGEAVIEFFAILGYACGRRDVSGEVLGQLVDLTDGAWLNRVDGGDDVEAQLPKFLVRPEARP